ncbi:MAG TPA: DnaJ domain-containing protein [Trichormus sp.]|jgi:curved DNA-binding protein CbpA
MQEFEEDFYAILGVEEQASPDEIRKAYLRLAMRLHPDRFPYDVEQRALAQTEFAKVTRAHDVISDGQRRIEYDALRALSKSRGAAAHAQSQTIPPEPNDAGVPEPHALAVDPGPPMTKFQQQQTTVDEENINVKWANKHLARADDLYRKKKYQEAETAMKEAIRLVPTDPKYRNKLAEIYFARGWKTLAMTEVQAALRIDPRDSEAKALEAKIKVAVKSQSQSQRQSKSKGNIIDQLKSIFAPKKP